MFASLCGTEAIPSHALLGGTEGSVQALCHPLNENTDKWVRKHSL